MNYVRKEPMYLDFYKMASLKKLVCYHFKIDEQLIFSSSKKQELVEARQIFHYLSHVILELPVNVVGIFSLRDYSTVLYSKKVINNFLEVNDKKTKLGIASIMKTYKEPSKITMVILTIGKCMVDIKDILLKK